MKWLWNPSLEIGFVDLCRFFRAGAVRNVPCPTLAEDGITTKTQIYTLAFPSKSHLDNGVLDAVGRGQPNTAQHSASSMWHVLST